MKIFKVLLSLVTLTVSSASNALAGEFIVDPGAVRNTHVGLEGTIDNFNLGIPIRDLGVLLSVLVQSAIILAGIGFFLYLILGGIRWMTTGGDPKATQAARDSITSALIGLIIVISTYGIIRIVEAAFGLTILSGNIKFPSP